MKIVIGIETFALGTATSFAPISPKAVCVLSLHFGIVTGCLGNNLIFEAIVSLLYNEWFEDARACKLIKFDYLILIYSEINFILFELVNRHPVRRWVGEG